MGLAVVVRIALDIEPSDDPGSHCVFLCQPGMHVSNLSLLKSLQNGLFFEGVQ